MDELEKQLRHTQDSSLYTNWQGGIFALEKIKSMIVANINAEIFNLKNLSNSTDMGKTMNRVAEATAKAVIKEEKRKENK